MSRKADRINDCDVCGEPHRSATGSPQCIAHIRREGYRRCRRAPVRGGTVCSKHGGKTPMLLEKLEKQRFLESREGEVAQLLEACDMQDMHPIEGLLSVVRHSGQMFRMLEGLVGDLRTDPTVDYVIEGMTDEGEPVTRPVYGDDGLWGLNAQGNQAPHILVTLYEKWTDIYSRACKIALDAGIDERRVQLAEQTTETMFNAVTRAMTTIALQPELRDAFSKALARELRTEGVDRAKELG